MERAAPHPLPAPASRSPREWAQRVYAFAQLPDRRLKTRLIRVAEGLAAAPSDSLPQTFEDWGQVKGAYRFVANQRVKPESLGRALPPSTALRCAGEELVLVVQDTTFLTFPPACHAEGLGPINDKPSRGIALHSALALRPDGLSLGVAHLHSWCRPKSQPPARRRANRPIEEKESFRWLEAMRAVHEAFQENLEPHERPRLCHVCDREGDIHELFALAEELGDAVVVRCARNRRVEVDEALDKAHDAISRLPAQAVLQLAVPRKPGQAARPATVEIRFQRQTLSPSQSAPSQRRRGKVRLWLVEVREPNPPEGVAPLHWRLWTNEPVQTLEEALRIVDIYCQRWRIEEYHRVLKEGCRIEQVRFRTAERIRSAIALYAPVALRIVELRDLARACPDRSCAIFLGETEWRVLWTLQHKRPPAPGQEPPTVAQAIRWIGALGGHLGRKRDGRPGTKTLWRGFRDLQLLVEYEEVRERLLRNRRARAGPP